MLLGVTSSAVLEKPTVACEAIRFNVVSKIAICFYSFKGNDEFSINSVAAGLTGFDPLTLSLVQV